MPELRHVPYTTTRRKTGGPRRGDVDLSAEGQKNLRNKLTYANITLIWGSSSTSLRATKARRAGCVRYPECKESCAWSHFRARRCGHDDREFGRANQRLGFEFQDPVQFLRARGRKLHRRRQSVLRRNQGRRGKPLRRDDRRRRSRLGRGVRTDPSVGPWGQIAYSEKVLYSFCAQGGVYCTDGAQPVFWNLITDGSGNLYGTTIYGGAHSQTNLGNPGSPPYGTGYAGTVFELSPNINKTNWTYRVLYSFCGEGGAGCTDGRGPQSGVIMGPDGRLYGSASEGGAQNSNCRNGACGVIFELSP